MAWRALGKKCLSATLTKAVAVKSSYSVASVSKYGAQDSARALSASVRHLHGHCQPTTSIGADKDLAVSANMRLVRCFHASPELLARRREDESMGLKTNKRVKVVNSGKFSKKKKENKPPVDTPYVPPKLMRAAKSLPDKTIEIFEGMTVGELARRCGDPVSIATIQNIIVNVGENAVSEFDALSIDIAELVAMEVGVNVRRLHSDKGVEVLPRPPVVTVMGHVDHGKTSLLDALRQTSVAAKEAGGITQHLGAFVVGMQSGSSITFLDTPGHAAFSAMRARGAAVTDVVVLVVAADDGVMPQTLEAMAHAKAANVPVVVAINKCDKANANPERVKIQLATEGLMLEEMGGDIQVVEVSAVKKTGLDQLEEALLLQAELMDLNARVDGPAQAYVVEARVDKGRGPLATAIVKAGTLVCGQHIVVGAEWGKIRCIRDTAKKTIAQAPPAMPVEIEGLKGLPMAGDDIVVVESEERARMLSEGRRKKIERDRLVKIDEERQKLEKSKKKSLEGEEDEEDEDEEEDKRVEVPIIVKADVQGTVQAVSDALKSFNGPQVTVKVIHAGVGPVSQSDVDMAQACDACIVGFNDIGNLIAEKAPGTVETKVAGEAQVLNIFEFQGRGKLKGEDVKIAGCRVVDGRLTRSETLRVIRSGEIVFEGCCASLKREQRDVDAVGKGNECGLVLKDYCDFQIGDVIQCLVQVYRKPKFVSSGSGLVSIEC
ncbi:translation initiation factor if-2 [Phtheirospermum japonicum]|uniref:Translation initiation factor IF-2, mitochondrial n=1 Tax=Phtheirospermum japonicum TaxID=374723 RepID=A0A830DB93_9LAMI|nr:translation initiation factor if-2 [Phtheirospermum japonicum]